MYGREIADVLWRKGFTIRDSLVYQRLCEYNKTIEITRTDSHGRQVAVYWLCGEDARRQEEDKEQITPLQLKKGTVTKEIAERARKRDLERTQIRFWKFATVAAIATIVTCCVNVVSTLFHR